VATTQHRDKPKNVAPFNRMQLPPLTRVVAALRETTETLGRELAVPTNEPPHWTEFEGAHRSAVTAMHGVSSLLYDQAAFGKAPKAGDGFSASNGINPSGDTCRSPACWMRSIRKRAAKTYRWWR